MLTRLGRELSQTEGAHYEGGPAVLVPCYYSLQCRLAGRPPSCTLCSEVGGGAIAARLTMCTGTGKVWAKVSRSAEYRAQLPPAMLHPILSGKAIPRLQQCALTRPKVAVRGWCRIGVAQPDFFLEVGQIGVVFKGCNAYRGIFIMVL